MATETWGLLPKSQEDPEKIEEAIARMIREHNENEESHLGAGQSLQSHKASEIIDHLARSVVGDKIQEGEIDLFHLTGKRRLLFTSFESLDGWGTTGSVYLDLGNCALWTTTSSGNFTAIDATPSNWTGFDIDKEWTWQATVRIQDLTYQEGYFGPSGHPDLGGLFGVGFRVLNNLLYAFAYINGEFTYYPITGVNISIWNVYRIKHVLNPEKYLFYVNDILKFELTEDLPSESDDRMAFFYIKTNTSARRKLYVSDFLFSIDK